MQLLAQDTVAPYYILLFALIVFIIVYLILKNITYKKGAYYKITKLSYFSVYNDKGRYGEYLIYKNLKYFETEGAKFLFNVYIPKKNSRMTEIDVLMISSKGIFVFESKNYSGWIFGNENHENWCQALSLGWGRCKKNYFYNPIMQNQHHIEALKSWLGVKIPVYSIVAFSDRCTLKDVTVNNHNVYVINRSNVVSVVLNIWSQRRSSELTGEQVFDIYNRLYPYSQVSENVKKRHVRSIALKCPRCKRELVLRTVKKESSETNKFYRCANYPKCTYIRRISKNNPKNSNDYFFD